MYFPKELLLITLAALSQISAASTAEEQYNELLTVKPLKDGKVATRFAFNVFQPSVRPRDPQLLLHEDECEHNSTF